MISARHPRNRLRLAFLALAIFGLFFCSPVVAESAGESHSRFRIEAPDAALRDVPLASNQVIRITALTPKGEIDKDFQGRVQIEGVRIVQNGEAIPPGGWQNGVLEIRSDLSAGREVYLTRRTIEVSTDDKSATHTTKRVWKGFSLLPPLVAIVLAIWLKEVIPALLAGVFAGALVLTGGDPFAAFLRTIDTHILHQLVPPDGESAHFKTLLFTMLLGAMIGIMSASGGTRALVDRLTLYTRTREHGQVMTWLLGLVVFFDDYANTLLVGSTMRSVSDRLRISREKLAFLVDSTAAPVAGLAVVSTWVAFEVDLIGTTLKQLGEGAISAEPYALFLATIPYRFYPLLVLVFVGAVAWSGRDFGPMRKREEEIFGDPEMTGLLDTDAEDDESPAPRRIEILNAIFPLVMLLCGITVGFLQGVDSYLFLVYSSFSAALVAGISAVATKSLPLSETVAAGIKGLQNMLLACVILLLAWSIGSLCDGEHLNTAGFIIDGLGDNLAARWMPAVAFVVAAAVSFATGSSFATMGLLMPLFISLTYSLMLAEGTTQGLAGHPYMLGAIGAILAGSIWGDHCSPISDTTVLSSAAAGCDHLAHVATQMPYAMTVGVVSLVCCYLPVAWEISPYITLPIAMGILLGMLRVIGRRPEA